MTTDDHVVSLAGPLNPREAWEATACPIERSLELVGSRSAFLVLREAFYGTTRFDDFARRVGVSESVTATRLRALVDAGILERRPYRGDGERTRHDYHLTQMGREFFPVLAALMQWGERWRGPVPITLQHHDCGERIRLELRCKAGHLVDVPDLDLAVIE